MSTVLAVKLEKKDLSVRSYPLKRKEHGAQVTMTGPAAYLGSIVRRVSSSLKSDTCFLLFKRHKRAKESDRRWDVKAPTYSLLVLFERGKTKQKMYNAGKYKIKRRINIYRRPVRVFVYMF